MTSHSKRFAWTTARDRMVTDGLRDGVSMDDIAALLGCTRAQADYRATQLRRETLPPEPTAGQPIHRLWFDEDFLRNVEEMAMRSE